MIPGWGRSLGGGNGSRLRYSCLENPVDRGAWRAAVRGAAQVPTGPKRLSARAAAEHRASASPAPAAPQQSRSTWPCCGLAFPAARAAGVDGYAGKERLGRVCGWLRRSPGSSPRRAPTHAPTHLPAERLHTPRRRTNRLRGKQEVGKPLDAQDSGSRTETSLRFSISDQEVNTVSCEQAALTPRHPLPRQGRPLRSSG